MHGRVGERELEEAERSFWKERWHIPGFEGNKEIGVAERHAELSRAGLCDFYRLRPARLLCPWGIRKASILEWLPRSGPEALPNPGMKSWSPAFQKDSLPSEPTREAQEYWSSLSLLQGNCLTQESNQGLLHCRWILYQLS